ncbi:MAG: DEAD/DEAH box helicase [Candidatus Bipolaricaulis anaerobius]|nr:DEAD/DEAH box helicase [Candidatus Bipolaricaulis anaerobius]MDD5764342.1 DEAD/DEAH box helicase [Candidatus Bipolaricaulis anaerobius]
MDFRSFAFHPRILSGIEAAGYTHPTPIQQQAIPVILEGHDMIGVAQTGTGKTAAFMLPILHRLAERPGDHVRAVVLAPTRELAEQIHQATRLLGRDIGVRSVALYGGVKKRPQAAALRRGVDVVIACPGRFLDLDGDRALDLSHVEVLVLDEADRMCDMGFLPDIRRILALLPNDRQTLFFSATMPPEIRRLAQGILRAPVTVQVDAGVPAKTVSHAFYPITEGRKRDLLLALLQGPATGRVLVFTRTKSRAQSLASFLSGAGLNVAAIEGDMSQRDRQGALDGFRSGEYEILVATDVAARGIDVEDITHVINFDLPDSVDAYTHRVGRTGRLAKTGHALSLSAPADRLLRSWVEKAVGKPIESRRLPGFDYGGAVAGEARPGSSRFARRARLRR